MAALRRRLAQRSLDDGVIEVAKLACSGDAQLGLGLGLGLRLGSGLRLRLGVAKLACSGDARP